MGQASLPLSEFSLIDRFFHLGVASVWPTQGIGDDCAILRLQETTLAITTDTVAIGTHFLPDAPAFNVGYKALAVNLSDLAAAGATPRAFFLALSIPKADAKWLEGFSAGLKEIAQTYGCALLGGDTTQTTFVEQSRAPATITITALGEIESTETFQGLTRAGAQEGDDIWVTGTVGDAYAALMIRTGQWQAPLTDYLQARMDRPTPRVEASLALIKAVATACADVSDGLFQDLGHILERSGLGACLMIDAPAASADLRALGTERVRLAQWGGGDDYELVFTARPSARARIEDYAQRSALPITRIGCTVKKEEGAVFLDENARRVAFSPLGFDHFAGKESGNV